MISKVSLLHVLPIRTHRTGRQAMRATQAALAKKPVGRGRASSFDTMLRRTSSWEGHGTSALLVPAAGRVCAWLPSAVPAVRGRTLLDRTGDATDSGRPQWVVPVRCVMN